MPELFKLKEEKFSEKDKEWQWVYSINFKFTFNTKAINEITITDHTWKKKGREKITKELILDIFKEKLNDERKEPRKKHSKRDIFAEERISYQSKKYRLVFWFKDYTDNHLWVRVCHQQD